MYINIYMSSIQDLRTKHIKNSDNATIENSTTLSANNNDNKESNNLTNLDEVNSNIDKLDKYLADCKEQNALLISKKTKLNISKEKKIEDMQELVESITKINMTSDKIKVQVEDNNKIESEITTISTEILKLEEKYNNKLNDLNSALNDINFFLESQKKE